MYIIDTESCTLCVCVITRLNTPPGSVYYDHSGVPRTRVHYTRMPSLKLNIKRIYN